MNPNSLAFAARVIGRNEAMSKIEVCAPHTLVISSKDHPPVKAIIVSQALVTAEIVSPIISEHDDHDFIANIPRESVWEGDAITAAKTHNMGWGGLGTLMAAVSDGDADTAQPKAYRFAQRLLEQHKNVERAIRLYDKVFLLERERGGALKVALVDDYELTADDVRTAFETYAPFDIVYKTNPNGKPTSEAHEAAEELGLEVHNHKSIMRRLHQ